MLYFKRKIEIGMSSYFLLHKPSEKMPKLYECEKCQFRTTQKYNWIRHIATKKHLNPDPLVIYSCQCCNYHTNEKSNYTRHLKSQRHLNTDDTQGATQGVTMDALMKENHLLKMENAGLRLTVAGWRDLIITE